MLDFTLIIYKKLISTLQSQSYLFQTLEDYIQNSAERVVIIRHDVDRLPENALRIAKLENELGVKASYYFRILPFSFDEKIIKEIANLGHEIGYHYENLSTAKISKEKYKSKKKIYEAELFELAIKDFDKNLDKFRKLYPVKTICMHGSPRSTWDSRDLWNRYNYKDFGIIAEPYFDIDFKQFAYFTDTGRCWNGDKFSVRDKVDSPYNYHFKSTQDIIKHVNELPDKLMFTVHPERWNDVFFPWLKAYAWQNIKNVAKRMLLKIIDKRKKIKD
jgi:hypothetical protein